MTNRHIDVLTAGWRAPAAALRRPVPAVLGIALLAPALLGTWTSEPGTTRGGEVHDELRLSVSTNASTDPGVRLRAGEPATRTYHLSNHAEYPLGGVLLSDPQLPGGRLACGADRSIPPGGALDCTATFTAAAGPQAAQVAAVADAPDHLPQAHADAPAGYLGITAGLRLTRVGTPSGTGLSHRSAPRTSPPGTTEPAAGPASGAAAPRPGASTRALPGAAPGLVSDVGGTIELQYRLEAFGDVPITGASITEGLPGLGTVDCAGPDGGRTLAPGQAVDCRAAGTARPGRQTGRARADGLADDATVGPDGTRQAPRQVSAEADGAYDGLRPTPPTPEPAGPATGAGSSPGASTGIGPGSTTGTVSGSGPATSPGSNSGPGTTGTGGTTGSGTPPSLSSDAVPPGLFPVSVPSGTRPVAAGVGQQPAAAAQAQPAAGAQALAGQLLAPFLPGQAPALLPGGTAFARPTSPFAAPGPSGTANLLSGNPATTNTTGNQTAAAAAAAAATAATASGPSRPAGQESGAAAGRPQSAPAVGRTAGGQAESQFAQEDWPPGEEDDTWDGTEVMMLLLAIVLPVLCVLAAAFTVRTRGRRGRW
ncbi:hypothetical protein [Kitasatospora cineracea]|uniref:hypothetical protein n=1 Tax=Kitasatospora cineracea TaxID=88074 RepID=UPI000F50C5DA|nr:hypothetical protein [Kitasatospora cineracea]